MQIIKLKNGKEVEMEITAGSVLDISKRLSIDIMDFEKLEKTIEDMPTFINVCFLLCEDSCKKLNITDIDFGRNITGVVLESLSEKFVKELISFCPLHKRDLLKRTMEFQEVSKTKAVEKVIESINQMQPQVEKMIDKTIQKHLESVSLNSST